jgi:hypothetical protein
MSAHHAFFSNASMRLWRSGSVPVAMFIWEEQEGSPWRRGIYVNDVTGTVIENNVLLPSIISGWS